MNSTIVVLVVFILLFLFIGACGIIKRLYGDEYTANSKNISVIVLYGTEDIKSRLCGIVHKMQWIDEELINRIILIDGGLNAEQKEICLNYCAKYDYMIFTSPGNLSNIVFELQKNT